MKNQSNHSKICKIKTYYLKCTLVEMLQIYLFFMLSFIRTNEALEVPFDRNPAILNFENWLFKTTS